MTSEFWDGKTVRAIDLLDIFPASEGEITQYYGRIGSGKTYAATADALELLTKGKVVYTNWRLQYDGTDERQSFFRILFTLFWIGQLRFYNFPKENLHYFEFSDKWAQANGHKSFIDWFASITDADIFGDEGHVMFDSYQGIKMSIDKRAAILHTRHFNRSIHIISQRPTAIHVSMRANVNRFYKCEVRWAFASFIRFRRSEYQDLLAETVDENPDNVISIKQYWGNKRVFNSYNSHYLRGDTKSSQPALFKAWDYNWFARWKLLYRLFFKEKPPKASTGKKRKSMREWLSTGGSALGKPRETPPVSSLSPSSPPLLDLRGRI